MHQKRTQILKSINFSLNWIKINDVDGTENEINNNNDSNNDILLIGEIYSGIKISENP